MTQLNKMQIVKDLPNKKLIITRAFDAPLNLVWRAWTEKELLDQWWAPKPWQTETKTIDFREGGYWHYAMVSPEGDKHWAKFYYKKIVREQIIQGDDSFCDEAGSELDVAPKMKWLNQFKSTENGASVLIEISFNKADDIETIIKMGFEEGFTMALSNLDTYLSAQMMIRKENKTSKTARASSYLNFSNKTEEAFNFYKQVFKSEFAGKGIQRFGSLPETVIGNIPEQERNLILHVELPILGGYTLMGTDAPESMGFKLTEGNNMHINLEPESREETIRLYTDLSEGGIIKEPLMDLPWGAFYGSCIDKFGINWMFHYRDE